MFGDQKCGGVSTEIIRGRLRSKLPRWQTLFAAGLCSAFVLSVISEGYRVEWKAGPPPKHVAPNHSSVSLYSDFVSKAIQAGMLAGAIEEVSDPSQLWCILPLGVAKNAEGKLRLIYDARFVNEFVADRKFKMETLQRQGRHVFADQRFGSVLDISSAFHHVEIHRDFVKYLGFQYEGRFYAWKSLPFGLSSAPRVFTAVTKPLVNLWRRSGFRVLPYLDDFPNAAGSWSAARHQARQMMSDLADVGFLVQKAKCVGVDNPLPSIRALGFDIDLAEQVFRCPAEKLGHIVSQAAELLRAKRKVAVRGVAALAGLITSITLAIGPMARIRSRSMLRNLEDRLQPGEDPKSKRAWARHIRLSQQTLAELKWWVEHAVSAGAAGMPIARVLPVLVADAMMACDASATGWGGWVGVGREVDVYANNFLANLREKAPPGVSLSAVNRAAHSGITVAGALSVEQAGRSSSWRELYAVCMMILALAPLLKKTSMKLQLDSQNAVRALGGELDAFPDAISGGSMKEDLQELVVRILDTCADIGLQLRAFWRPREENARADALSHHFEHDQYDYTLCDSWVRWLDQHWGPHAVDRFASNASNCVVSSGAYNSLYGQGDAGWEWADALSVNWAGVTNWVHPPYMLLDEVLDHAIACRARGTLIVPDWPSASWWPRLFRGNRHSLATAPRSPIGVATVSPGVRDVIWLGLAENVLYYPTKGSDFARRHLPKGHILAVRFDFACY